MGSFYSVPLADRVPVPLSVHDVRRAAAVSLGRTSRSVITQTEFIAAFSAFQPAQTCALQFTLMDTDRDGRNDALELFAALYICCRGGTLDKCEGLFSLYDFDNDGRLSRAEVILLVRGALRGLAKICSGRMPRLPCIENTVTQMIGSDEPDAHLLLPKFASWCSQSATFAALTNPIVDQLGANTPPVATVQQVVSTGGAGSRSLGRISGCWTDGLNGGINSTDNPQFLLRLRVPKAKSRLVPCTIILQRVDDGPQAHPLYLYVFKRATGSSRCPAGITHRMVESTGHQLVEVTQASQTRVAVVNAKLMGAPESYIVMPCLQTPAVNGAFTISVKTSALVRADITQLPIVQVRYTGAWSSAATGKCHVLLRLPPFQLAKVALIDRNTEDDQQDDSNSAIRCTSVNTKSQVIIRSDPVNHSQVMIDNRSGATDQELWVHPTASARKTSGAFDIVVTASNDVKGRATLTPVAVTTVVGAWAAGHPSQIPQILLRFLSPQTGLARVQIALHRTDGGPKVGIVVCVYQVTDPLTMVRLPAAPLFQSRYAVTDSVTFVVTLPTTPLFVIMPLLERSDVSGTFTLAVQKRNLRVDGTVDDIEIIDPSALSTTGLQLQTLPSPSMTRLRGRWDAAQVSPCHVDHPQFLLKSKTPTMVHIEVVADTDPNHPADGPHLFVYRGLQRDARRKSLNDVDLVESSSPTSSRTSLTLRYEPQDVSSFVIVVGRRRPGRFVICVTASCETVSLTALPPAPAIVPVEGPGNEPSAPSTSYADAVKRCERDEAAFVDAAFPPGRAAIGGPDRFASSVRGWMRIGDVCDSPRLSADGVAFEDIQLHCRDLSFLVQALSALGVRAGRLVRRAFTPASSSASPWGVYSVRLHDYQRRHPVDVVVDDYIPVDDMHRPCFVRCCDPNLVWILLLVKAFAKMHGSYYALSTASRNDDAVPMAVYALTGEAPATVTLGLSDVDDDRVWPAVYDATHDGGVCVCCVPRPPWELTEQGIPLPWHQGYALVDTVQSGSVRLGVVRRTWGRHEPFEGRWALGSDAWNTSGDSKAFAADEIDPVSFFVDLTELRRMFSSVVLCPIPHDISGPFVYETMQTGVFHETLSEGTGRTGNPQFLFAARHGSVAISLRVPFVELRHRHRLSLTLCRVTSKTPLPLSKIAPGQVVACSAEPVPGRASTTNRDGARLEVTLPVRRSHRPILYVVIVGYGSSGAEAPFTITMQSTERTFLSRVAHVDQRACDDVLSRCLADPLIVPEPEKLATSAQR